MVFCGNKLMIVTQTGFTEVELYIKDKKLKSGKGYIYEGNVYICDIIDKNTNENKLKPGLYSKNGKNILIEGNANNINIYDCEDIINLDAEAIKTELETSPENFMSEEELEELLVDRDVYTPVIKADDDFLKVIIKKAIISKGVNIKKKYKDSFDNPNQLSNMLSSLRTNTKMSVVYFMLWCSILDIGWEITVFDNGQDNTTPLTSNITISSDSF